VQAILDGEREIVQGAEQAALRVGANTASAMAALSISTSVSGTPMLRQARRALV
jgi:hypothetical protein